MANWQAIAGGPLFGEVFAPLESIAETAQAIISPVQTILSIIQSILKIIRVFLIDATSILIAIIQALVDEIEQFLQQLANAGIYILPVGPTGQTTTEMVNSVRGGFDGFVNKVYNKFYDVADPQRPMLGTSQPAGGVILAVSTGNIAGALNLLGLISNAFLNIFKSMYVPPTIKGVSGNGTNVITFQKPNLPSDMFTGVTYVLQRSLHPGGNPVVVQQPGALVNPLTKDGGTYEQSRDPYTNNIQRYYETVAVINESNAFLAPEEFFIVDGPDDPTAQLVKLDFTSQANTKHSTVGGSSYSGPSTFSIHTAPGFNIFQSISASTHSQINASIPEASQSADFKKGFINGFWLDFRVNGVSIGIGSQSSSQGSLLVDNYDGSTITLTQNVPLGAKVEAYTYVQAKTSDMLLYKNYKAGRPSLYSSTIQGTPHDVNKPPKLQFNDPAPGAPVNGTSYFYRVAVMASASDTVPQSISNEIKLTPKLNVAPNSLPAFCVGSKQAPFFISSNGPASNNKIAFTVRNKNFQVALRPSRQNKFSKTPEDFENNYGLTLNPSFTPTTNVLLNTGTQLSNAAFSSEAGLQYTYIDANGKKQSVLPGDLIPVDAEQVLLDLRTQTNDPSVRFAVSGGHIIIQDASAGKGSYVEITTPCDALGFAKGVCMNVPASQPPDWYRIAVKDFLPQIFVLGELIQSVANGLISAIESGVRSLVDFIDLLSTKIKVLQDFLQQIQNILNLLKNLKIQLPNMYILRIPEVNGTDALAQTVLNASGRPLSSPNDFAMGIVLIVAGVDVGPVLPILHAIL